VHPFIVADIASEPVILIVLFVIVLVFGAGQLPKLARSLGSASHEFRKGQEEGAKGLEGTQDDSKNADNGGRSSSS
jgi:sec-independent protein translocase protein TatA